MALIKYFPRSFGHLKYQCMEGPYSLVFCKPAKNQRICGTAVLIPMRFYFHESSWKGAKKYEEQPKRTPMERIPHGYEILKRELRLWFQEIHDKFRHDPKIFSHGDTDVLFRFSNEEDLKKWKTVSDKMHNEGFSHCQLELNNNGTAVFSGVVDTTVPKDGRIRRAGYCSMKSYDKMKSFLRMDVYHWAPFTHLEFRVRGDGRNYMIGLSTKAYCDINWMDLYSYAIHTRGGPYWQTIKIPFSKFFLTSKGFIQDKQFPLPKDDITAISIMCAKIPGPFKLEIDYIGVHKDDLNFEEFAYELYLFPKDMISTW